jgi:DNA polymerase-4
MNRSTKIPIIAHFDLDSFFVSVERLKDTSLNAKPIIVTQDPSGRSVVSSASYEARRFGICAGMPITQAKKLCPEVRTIRGNYSDYRDYHRRVFEIISEFSPLVEVASIDEGYLDLTGVERLLGSPISIGRKIYNRIKVETGLDCSIGISTSKLVAKVATNFAKPCGILWIEPGNEKTFLSELQVEELPGVGIHTKERLHSFGINTIGDLASLNKELLVNIFGTRGIYLYEAANGVWESPLVIETNCKSIGKEITFKKDTGDFNFLLNTLSYLVEIVCFSLREKKRKAKTVIIKIRYENFETISRSRSLAYPVNQEQPVFDTAISLLKRSISRKNTIRLIGISVSNLVDVGEQLGLFKPDADEKADSKAKAIDMIKNKFGFNSLLFGLSLNAIDQQ